MSNYNVAAMVKEWAEYLESGRHPSFELELKDDDYLLVDIELVKHSLVFSFDESIVDNPLVYFDGLTRKIRKGVYSVALRNFCNLTEALQHILADVEAFISDNDLQPVEYPELPDNCIVYSVCRDCLFYIVNNDVPDHLPDNADSVDNYHKDMQAHKERELNGSKGYFVTGVNPSKYDPDGDGTVEFSIHSCELCNSNLAGSRHGVTLILK